jgi:hypothetical protein
MQKKLKLSKIIQVIQSNLKIFQKKQHQIILIYSKK